MEKVRQSSAWFDEQAILSASRGLLFMDEQFAKHSILPLGNEQRAILRATLEALSRGTMSSIAELALTGSDVTFAVLPKPPIDPDAAPSPL